MINNYIYIYNYYIEKNQINIDCFIIYKEKVILYIPNIY